MVKFGSFEPVQLKTPQLSQQSHPSTMAVRESNAFLCKGKEENLDADGQGWTLVTRRKGKKKGKILQARPPTPLIL